MNKLSVFIILLIGIYTINAENVLDLGIKTENLPVSKDSSVNYGKIANTSSAVPVKSQILGAATKVVIGADDRVKYNTIYSPLAGVGKVVFGKNQGFYCTGYLIGPRHVLTNAQCVDRSYTTFFYPSYNNGYLYNKLPVSTYAKVGYFGTSTADTTSGTYRLGAGFSLANDWAVLVLDQYVGNVYGYFGVVNFQTSFLNNPVFYMAGYPQAGSLNSNGLYPVYQSGCALKEYDYNTQSIYHNCDASKGSSGSGIFAYVTGYGYCVAALQNAEISINTANCAAYNKAICANVAVSSGKFINAVVTARSQYP